MNPIGGYFELELKKGKEFHRKSIRLNTGRNAFELLVHLQRYKKVYLPSYTCNVFIEPMRKHGIVYEIYPVDRQLEPIFDYSKIMNNEGFLYINYFGIKDSFIKNISQTCQNLVIDNCQAFFSQSTKRNTFYSARKFFGVPDGAYLYLDHVAPSTMPQDVSANRMAHLMKRIDYGAEAGYSDFKENERHLASLPIMQMSQLTQALLSAIDYPFVKKRRQDNYAIFEKEFGVINQIATNIDSDSVPMVYPLLINSPHLNERLISHKIFIPTFWENMHKSSNDGSNEYHFSKNLVCLPIDQRYTKQDIDRLVSLLRTLI